MFHLPKSKSSVILFLINQLFLGFDNVPAHCAKQKDTKDKTFYHNLMCILVK